MLEEECSEESTFQKQKWQGYLGSQHQTEELEIPIFCTVINQPPYTPSSAFQQLKFSSELLWILRSVSKVASNSWRQTHLLSTPLQHMKRQEVLPSTKEVPVRETASVRRKIYFDQPKNTWVAWWYRNWARSDFSNFFASVSNKPSISCKPLLRLLVHRYYSLMYYRYFR